MINKKIDINMEGSLEGRYIETYFYSMHDDLAVKMRPLVIICPGGGYNHLSVREGESIAYQFNAMGYNSAVLQYSIKPSVYPAPLLELAYAFKFFKEHGNEYGVDSERIVIYGASAGSHLVGLFGTGYYREEITKALNVSENYLKPQGLILAYPVITSGEFAHRGSFECLLGDEKSQDKAWLDYVSIEKRINEKTPECFIWHTFDDGTVPLENSLLLANALRKANVHFEYHVFPHGGHGLALANELTLTNYKTEIDEGAKQWVSLCKTWLSNLLGPLL